MWGFGLGISMLGFNSESSLWWLHLTSSSTATSHYLVVGRDPPMVKLAKEGERELARVEWITSLG